MRVCGVATSRGRSWAGRCRGGIQAKQSGSRDAGNRSHRAKQLAARQFGPQATVDSAQAAYDQANAGIAKTEAIISQKLVRAPFDGELGVRHVEVGQYLTAGTQIVSLTDLSQLYANFTVTEKDSAALKVGQTVRIAVDAYPGRTFEGKINAIEPQIATDTRNIRVQATLDNPEHILKLSLIHI